MLTSIFPGFTTLNAAAGRLTACSAPTPTPTPTPAVKPSIPSPPPRPKAWMWTCPGRCRFDCDRDDWGAYGEWRRAVQAAYGGVTPRPARRLYGRLLGDRPSKCPPLTRRLAAGAEAGRALWRDPAFQAWSARKAARLEGLDVRAGLDEACASDRASVAAAEDPAVDEQVVSDQALHRVGTKPDRGRADLLKLGQAFCRGEI